MTDFKSYGSDSWIILSDIETRIKEKIEKVGVPLKDWDINIYRGVLTGFNEAFIIDGKKKEEILNDCKTEEERLKTDELIRPILRGRDIKRYSYDFADLYLIATFPSLKIDIEHYPAVRQHLLSFGYDRLKQTGDKGSRKKTNNKWFETQDSISYWEDFYKQKIVWGEISDRTKFCIDLDGEFTIEATNFLMTGHQLLYLLGFLNSKLSEYFFSKIGTTTGVGTVRWKKYTVEQLRIPIVSPERQKEYDAIVKEVVARKTKLEDYDELLIRLDSLIYQELELSKEEINFIESQ